MTERFLRLTRKWPEGAAVAALRDIDAVSRKKYRSACRRINLCFLKEKERKSMTNTTGNKTMMNLQDSFLNHVRKENLPVVIYLVNGFQIRGMVRGFDNFTVIIENDGKQQLVYKHAVSTISPVANITIMQPEKAEKKE